MRREAQPCRRHPSDRRWKPCTACRGGADPAPHAELGHLAPIVRHEHERWDGQGYPDGLAGTEIPIASRIILACDAYNAMITTRPYREAMSPRDAVAELRAKSGSQFDPQVVAALLKRLRVPAATSGSAASAS